MLSVIYGTGVQLFGSILDGVDGMDENALDAVRRALRPGARSILVASIMSLLRVLGLSPGHEILICRR
jgi:hypothetical protein